LSSGQWINFIKQNDVEDKFINFKQLNFETLKLLFMCTYH